MTIDVAMAGAGKRAGTEIHPDVRRLREDAERVWGVATGHRTLAAELAAGNEQHAFHRAKTQRMLGEVAAQHAFAYHELANAAEARAESWAFPRESPQWKRLVDETFAAIRRAEAHHERAAALSARTAGDEAAARRHEAAARDPDRRAASLASERWSA